MGRKSKVYREYDKETGELIKLECGKCHEIKTTDCFHKNKNKKDGVGIECKQCYSERHRQYSENNKEKISERNRLYYENNKKEVKERRRQYRENNKEKISERDHRYRINNKEKVSDYHRQWYENNKKEISDYQRQYRENNKDKIKEHQHQLYKDKVYQEIRRIYRNVTKQCYPHNGIQYGVIYGVVCNNTNRWYIGQTTTSFNARYQGDFFKYKFNELSEDNSKGQLLADDIEKYGQENFEIFEVIDVAFSEKELDEKEAYYIDLYKAYDEGYNTQRGNIFKHGKAKRC